MRIRLLTLAMAALFVLSVGCLAQTKNARAGRQGKAPRAGQAGYLAANQLGLDKDQMAKVRDIVKKFHDDVRDVIKSDAAKQDKQSKVAALKTKAGDAILALLTPDQQAKAKETRCIDRMLSPRRPGAHGLAIILKQLNLTTEQKASTKTILQNQTTQAKAIRDDTSLTREQKAAQFIELRKATIEKIAGVLDQTQRAKFRELLAKLPKPGTHNRGNWR